MKQSKQAMKMKSKLTRVLTLFFVIVAAAIFFKSPLAEIQTIKIKGNLIAGGPDITEKSKLVVGNSFFAFRAGAAENRIEDIPGVKSANVKRSFPGKITLEIDEYRLAAYQVVNGKAEMVLEDGHVLPMNDLSAWLDRPILSNWTRYEKLKLKLCSVLAELPYEQVADLSEILPAPTKAYPDKIKIYTRSSFEVVTTVSKLKGKMPYLANVVNDLKEAGQMSGRITMLEANSSQPFINNSQE
jgi:cell division protein FtsQ